MGWAGGIEVSGTLCFSLPPWGGGIPAGGAIGGRGPEVAAGTSFRFRPENPGGAPCAAALLEGGSRLPIGSSLGRAATGFPSRIAVMSGSVMTCEEFLLPKSNHTGLQTAIALREPCHIGAIL